MYHYENEWKWEKLNKWVKESLEEFAFQGLSEEMVYFLEEQIEAGEYKQYHLPEVLRDDIKIFFSKKSRPWVEKNYNTYLRNLKDRTSLSFIESLNNIVNIKQVFEEIEKEAL